MKSARLEIRTGDGWQVHAKCGLPEYRNMVWFPEDWEIGWRRERERKRVEDVCGSCPVMAECRNFADTEGITAGIWAGRNYGRPSEGRKRR